MIAIYARKSVFREDSISIESQIEHCQYEAKGEETIVYSDNGFSGKNTDRPEYQRMIEDIKSKKINKVIVYKLDRISRSILDFSTPYFAAVFIPFKKFFQLANTSKDNSKLVIILKQSRTLTRFSIKVRLNHRYEIKPISCWTFSRSSAFLQQR